MKIDRWARLAALGTGLALFAWFVFLIRGGLDSWFDADDLMNLHYCWSRPWSDLLKANLFFWSSYIRPGGCLFYLSTYTLWGFHPLPFRIVVFLLLCINFGLLALVVRQLTGSRWCALLALLLFGINPGFAYAFFDTGNIYDLLAYAFLWGAFAWYVRIRQAGRIPGWGSMAVLLVLFVEALNSKEISVVLPAAAGLYELCWHPPAAWRTRDLWLWIRNEGRFTSVGGLFAVAYVIGKRYGAESLWRLGPYRPHYSVAAYFTSQAHYLKQIISQSVNISPWQTAWLLAAMLVFAAATRQRSLLWGMGFVLTGILPLAFIPGRGGPAYLVPSIGWAVYVSGFSDWLIATLAGRRIWLRGAFEVLLLTLLFVKLAPWQRKWIAANAQVSHNEQSRFSRYRDQIHALIPAPRKGARILLLSDAEGRDDYDVHFVTRLLYGDPALDVERATVWKERHVQMDPSRFDYVLDWVDGRFVLVSHK